MTVTTNERGQQNLFAREPQMYISKSDAERYGYETYAEKGGEVEWTHCYAWICRCCCHPTLLAGVYFSLVSSDSDD